VAERSGDTALGVKLFGNSDAEPRHVARSAAKRLGQSAVAATICRRSPKSHALVFEMPFPFHGLGIFILAQDVFFELHVRSTK
jgi:hypothetical protein